MRSSRWGVLGTVVGALGGVAVLLLLRVPPLVAVLLGAAAVVAIGFTSWADHVARERAEREPRK